MVAAVGIPVPELGTVETPVAVTAEVDDEFDKVKGPGLTVTG